MEYFHYEFPGQKLVLIGTEKEQIIKTMEYYSARYGVGNIVIPTENQIRNILKIDIGCSFPPKVNDQSFTAEVRDNVSFEIYSNAFYYVRFLSDNYDKINEKGSFRYRRGELFKFDTGLKAWGVYLLPKYIMEGLREYNFDQHEAQVIEWLKGGDGGMQTLRGKPK
ncbi:MAG TPA: hypothetical protein VJJ23_03830 [Candidatus Nanoarchaeia archaeon]|nr:hypothetical protein [Candidatus Nanoarchaeia archaeon]